MSSRSLNKVQLIGNLTRDPELRYTPTGAAVCTLGIATNRTWTTDAGEKKEETEFHRVVAWNKLAELCSQLLVKGRKIFVEGRLRTNTWTAQDGTQRNTTEVVIEDMIILDSKRTGGAEGGEADVSLSQPVSTTPTPIQSGPTTVAKKPAATPIKSGQAPTQSGPNGSEDINPDDIPF